MRKYINIDSKTAKNSKSKSNRYRQNKGKFLPFFIVIVCIILWHTVVATGTIENFILPYPMDVIKTLFRILPEIKMHILVTIQEAVIGLLIAIGIGLILSFLFDVSKSVKRGLYPLLLMSQTVPIVVLAPIFALILGLGMLPKIVVVVLICSFPIVISLTEGIEAVDEEQINLLRSMGARQMQVFWLVKFPSAMISFFSGLKVAVTYSFTGAVIGEWMGGKYGLGLYFLRAKKSFLVNEVFAAVIIMIVISMVFFYTITLIQYLGMPWLRNKGKVDN